VRWAPCRPTPATCTTISAGRNPGSPAGAVPTNSARTVRSRTTSRSRSRPRGKRRCGRQRPGMAMLRARRMVRAGRDQRRCTTNCARSSTSGTLGVPRTYLYELVDQGGGDFGSYGLVDAATQPKPIFHALAALLARLSVKNSAPASLDYALTAGSTVDSTLLATRPAASCSHSGRRYRNGTPRRARRSRFIRCR
jgi:hypothetical protein